MGIFGISMGNKKSQPRVEIKYPLRLRTPINIEGQVFPYLLHKADFTFFRLRSVEKFYTGDEQVHQGLADLGKDYKDAYGFLIDAYQEILRNLRSKN